ncbi:MAG: hypothetical protein QOC96_388 [Acidobacteriota bacterium]|nr:hypothetical protein [Acidobacteriota bacterium]
MRESLDSFRWDTSAGKREFKSFLKFLDRRLPFPKSSNLSDHETAFRIYCATNGFIGYLMKLVRRAAILAIDRKAECLNPELLAESYDERLSSRAPRRANPFIIEFEKLEIEPLAQVEFISRKTNHRSKAITINQSAASVLARKKKS